MMSESEARVGKSDFLTVLQRGLEIKDINMVRMHLFDPEKEEDVAACAFEALRPIHKAMVSVSDDIQFYSECIEWLLHLVIVGTPKELLLGLLEIVEEEGSLVNCVPIIPLLETTLLKLPAKRVSSLEWALSALDKYIQLLSVPKDVPYEGDKRKLLDLDPDVITICEVLSPYITLIKTFVVEVSLPTCSKQRVEERVLLQRRLLIRYLLSVLGYPLAFVDLERKPGAARSKTRRLAEECVSCLHQLAGYIFSIYQIVGEMHLADATKNSHVDMGLAVLAYLFLSENVSDICPSVYEPWYLLETHLKFANMFLCRTETFLVLKGVSLTDAILSKLSKHSLSALNLDFSELLVLCEKLFNVMLHCSAKEIRTMALQDFKQLVDKFDSVGTCQLLIILLQGHNQPMVQSLLLNVYKDQLHKFLNEGIDKNPFVKNNLERVLKIATKMEQSKVETDLIDNSSRILSAFNLLRYVALKEKNICLGVCEWLKKLNENFLDPLRLALNLSRAHYKKQLEDSRSAKPQLPSVVEFVTVQGQALPDLPPDYESQICSTALTTFDLIESVMVRLEENLQETVFHIQNK